MLLNCKGILLDLSTPAVMGILNCTPDSFYDGSEQKELQPLQVRIEQLVKEGADIIDVGGMSSRPGAEIITIEEEWSRVEPAIEYITSTFPDMIISIDTLHSQVAKLALEKGAHMVNDISAGHFDKNMLPLVAQQNVPVILMHMRNLPKNMQKSTSYDKGLILEIMAYFKERLAYAKRLGIKDIILDPGFGFSKTINQNFYLMNALKVFRILDLPILVGISRKSSIYKTLGVSPEEALNGTTAMNMVALLQGSQILRVHDVKQAKEAVKLFLSLENNTLEPI